MKGTYEIRPGFRASPPRLSAGGAAGPGQSQSGQIPAAKAVGARIRGFVRGRRHPDYMEPAIIADPKTGKLRSEITRDQVSEVLEFLGKFSALSERKVVLIDAIDDLNVSAANSLLKWLEEPRQAP